MGFFCSTKSFWPQGRERYIALGLVGVIAATCYFNICFMCDKVEQQVMVAASSPPVFDIERASIDPHQIFAGGPPKDGIPALTDPKMIEAAQADFLSPNDRVVGVDFDGEARAYPLKILQWHEIVNAETEETSFAVVYCPLCDSTTVFDRRVNDEVLEFGVSGLLYQSNVLIYDRQSKPDDESLWSQMQGEAVAGKRTGQQLALLPHQLVTWQEWLDAHPKTQVLSNKTGHKRNYQGNIYQAYFDGDNLMFSINHHDKRLPIKQPVLGLFSNGESKAYPLALMKKGFEFSDEVGGEKVALKKLGNDRVWVEAGPAVEVVHSFWFAWSTFYPDTQVYDGGAIQVADSNRQMKDAR